MEENKKTPSKVDLIKTIVGIVLCVIFGFILICNVVIIVKGAMNDDEPPSIFSVTPLVVTSGSMSGKDPGHIEVGDLIFLEKVAYKDLNEGDVITFKDGGSYTTHRIIGWDDEVGGYITKGDANNTEDSHRVVEKSLVGRVTGRVPVIGNVILFLQKPLGMILCVGVPLAAYIGLDVFFRMKAEKQKTAAADDKTAALEAELERLRALAGEKAQNPEDKGE